MLFQYYLFQNNELSEDGFLVFEKFQLQERKFKV